MEYRIAPFVMLGLAILLQLFIMPEWHDSALLIDKGRNMIIIQSIIGFFAISAYYRHAYYSRREKWAFYVMLSLYLAFFIKYIYQYLNF